MLSHAKKVSAGSPRVLKSPHHGEMKRVISEILHTRCRPMEIQEEERQVFDKYSHLQRYHPGLDIFLTNDSSSRKYASFPTRYTLSKWEKQADSLNHFNCIRTDRLSPDFGDASGHNPKEENVKVFVKIIHLLDPISVLHQEYMTPEHPLLPQGEKAWRHTLQKLHSTNNQAYVDTIANHILSRFRELDLTPHCTLSYGSITGIAQSYKYRLTDDYMSYRQCRWFWRGIRTQGAKLEILKDSQDLSTLEEYKDTFETYFKCPFEDVDEDDKSVTELSEDNLPHMEEIDDGVHSLHSFTFDETTPPLDSAESAPGGFKQSSEDDEEPPELEELISSDDDDDEDDTLESGDTCESLEINLELPTMPVIMVYQECHEGTMDKLLEQDEICGHKRGSKGWERIWLAWIWQVMAALGFLQKTICFTHNDLHTNNVLWRETKDEFIYYRSRDNTVWRVPTYGKIFSLIDFGRAIFRLGKELWISDDHWSGNDAGGQYNFGPILNRYEPKVTPNPSFDLCRFAISALDGLFEEIPAKRKGRMIPPLSQDGSWIVYETISPLFNLLYSWTVDDEGKTIYEDEEGEERYPGFELYIRIARDIHKAIPREQFTKPIFDTFRYKGKIPQGKTVYSLGS